jgi:hypothetical protein
MTSLRFLPAVLAAAAVFSAAPLASALVAPPGDPTTAPDSSCATNADCGRGYECTVVGASGCAPSACADGASCPPPEPCTTTETRACTPAHCMADADCADGMVCHAWEQATPGTDCACAPGVPCDCAAARPAEPVTVQLCTPRYVLPCTQAADCGSGFSCEEVQSCGCAGSAGSAGGTPTPGPNGSGASPVPPDGAAGASANDVAPPDCSCQPTGELQCVVVPVMCQVDTQCAPGWHCALEVAVSSPAPACPPGMDCPQSEPAPMPVSGYCQPPYYGAQSGSDLQGPKEANSGSGTSGPGTTTGNGTGGGTTATPAPQNPAQPGSGEAHESSACSFGHAPASHGALGILSVLGALLGLSRRRRVQR